jgi:RNA polymerase sigma-70 factor (ECF subfamily)
MASDSTTYLQGLLDRVNGGDAAARDELIATAYERLHKLTRKIFQDFRRVHRFEDSADVLQNSLVRLQRRLKSVSVASVKDFFYLAAREIRLELMDLARHYFGPSGQGTNQVVAVQSNEDSSAEALQPEPLDRSSEPAKILYWTEFHNKVEALPALERATVDLLWYHGMTQEEAAGVLNISLASLKRHWMAARLRLQDYLRDYPIS